ncbi:MAG: FAD-binding protein [Bryobacteraceae bacterium]
MDVELLKRVVDPARVLTRPIDRIAFASDASVYRLIPSAVVLARGVEEIQALFRFSHEHRVPITFRAAGTSLSGQAITDGILVEVARHWREARVEAGGKRVRNRRPCEPDAFAIWRADRPRSGFASGLHDGRHSRE